jgi:hypothetical protein
MKNLISITALLAASVASHAQFTVISADFESDTPGMLYEGARYNYTDNMLFNQFFTSMNVVVFRHGTATKYIVSADPLNAENQVMWINGADNAKNDGGRGMFLMNLDLTGEGAYTEGLVKLSYSFRMLRDGANANSPTSWEITWVTRPETPDDGTENLDAWAWLGEEVIDTFTTSGDESEWVTVEGFLIADLADVDTTNPFANGLHVRATDGAWVSGGNGIYYIDDIVVTVSQGDDEPEPSTWAGFEIVDDAGSVDTGSWMGWISVADAPWIYHYGLTSWMYIEESGVGQAGGWVYVLK